MPPIRLHRANPGDAVGVDPPTSVAIRLVGSTVAVRDLASELDIEPSELLTRLIEIWLAQVTEAADVVLHDGPDGTGVTIVPIDANATVRSILGTDRLAVEVARAEVEHPEALARIEIRTGPDGSHTTTRGRSAASVLLADDAAVLDPSPGRAWRRGNDDETICIEIDAQARSFTVGAAERSTVEPITIAAAADSLRAFVSAALDDPSTPIRLLPLVGPETSEMSSTTWNATQCEFPEQQRLDEEVWSRANTRPDAVAVSDGETTISYAELVTAADALAHRLRRCGVGAGDVVAVSMPRCSALVEALLAILRCGAAYLPLDVGAPDGRNELIRSISGASVELVLAPDRGVEIRLAPDPPVAVRVAPDIACVMHTSGSTGVPKAVQVTMRGIQRLIRDTDSLGLGPRTVMAMVSSPAFDALTFEVWGALCNGGRIEIVATEDLVDPHRLAVTLAGRSITTMLLTTAVFNTVSARVPDAFAPLEHLVVGGEALDAGAIRRVLAHAPARLSNVYGPTECACLTTIGPIVDVPDDATTVPIGLPLANTTVDLIDRFGRLVPAGFEGEILIGGPAVGRGYLGDDTATAAHFVSSPLRPGTHYRSGDIARRLPDGRIDFVGRRDAQVKLRGHRIELGEVERALAGLAGVAAAAVTVQGSGATGRLIAHVVATDDDLTHDDIRVALGERLPAVMVPAGVAFHDELPITPSGKLDRRTLAADSDPMTAGAGLEPVRTMAVPDRAVAQMCRRWADALGMANVRVDDDFFDLGGNSLLAIDLLGGIERDCGVQLPLSALLEARTPAALTAAIATSTGNGRQSLASPDAPSTPVVHLRDDGHSGGPPLWMIHPAGGSHVVYEPLVRRMQTPQRVLGVDAIGLDGSVPPLATVEALADHQFRWITAVQPSGPYAMVGYSIGGIIGLEVARRLLDRGEEIAYLAAIESDLPEAVNTEFHVPRAEAYRRLFASRDLAGLIERVGQNSRRRLEQLAGRHLGMRPSARQVDENVRLAMVDAFCRYEGDPVAVAMDVVMGTDNDDGDVDAILTAWRRIATGDVTLVEVPGSHDTVLEPPTVDAVAAAVDTRLARCLTAQPGVVSALGGVRRSERRELPMPSARPA